MKQLSTIFILFLSVTPAFAQTALRAGDDCFKKGDYSCAISKYQEAIKTTRGGVKQSAEIKLGRAKSCAAYLKDANWAFHNRDYKAAQENYELLAEENPDDAFAKAQLEKCTEALKPETTLSTSVSNVHLSPSGDPKTIKVHTNAMTYSVISLPSWCSVERYGGYFVIAATANTSDKARRGTFKVIAKFKEVTINVSQDYVPKKPETTLSVSKTNLSFGENRAEVTIEVETNETSYTVTQLPPWCRVRSKYPGWFFLEYDENHQQHARSSWFVVTAGSKKVRVNVQQAASTKKPETTLWVSKTNLFFGENKGVVMIEVETNETSYTVAQLPPGCRVRSKYPGWFALEYDENHQQHARSSWFVVTAGSKKVRVNVRQDANTKKYRRNRCFNCPKMKNTWGLTVGYIQMEPDFGYKIEGYQFGLKAEPLFKYGFGLNTGILFEMYPNVSEKEKDYNPDFSRYNFNIPLHLEYRLNFSKWFNVFAYGGIGINAATNGSFGDFRFPATFEYGGGVRIGRIQFNVGKSEWIGDYKDISNIGKNRTPYQNLVISMSGMF